MKYINKVPAVLLLEDGTVFHGKAAGLIGTATGEICFNTGMTGYQEIFTDPSYYGQLVVCTNAHIGNYGVASSEVESDSIKISGLICKNFNQGFSRARANGSLNDYFVNNKIVAVCDVDTRALVRYIRNKGVMNAVISSEVTDIDALKGILRNIPSMEGLELSSKVSATAVYDSGIENSEFKVSVLDLGIKQNILRCLNERNCHTKVFPMNSSIDELLAWGPDGIMLTNGPGDPAAMPEVVEKVKQLIETDIPIFGICLGHQIISTSVGLSTYKMHNGHRGINHPIKNLKTGKSEITSQNHGFVVSREKAEGNPEIKITHLHLNDNTLAGIELTNKKVFSVQYHPESSPGPHDSRYLFDEFIENMKVARKLQKGTVAKAAK